MIELKNLRFSYGKGSSFSFDLSVKKGEKLWIHGPSGSGKTTLFKLLLGFVQADEGEIRIGGEDLNSENLFYLRQKMSYVPQHSALGRGKVMDIYREIFSFKGNRHLKLEQEEVAGYFQKFGLGKEKMEKNFEELSGGEQQRVAIILALLLKRSILLLDEAVSAIDQKQRKVILEHLAETDRTIILVAHDSPQMGAFREIDFHQIKTN